MGRPSSLESASWRKRIPLKRRLAFGPPRWGLRFDAARKPRVARGSASLALAPPWAFIRPSRWDLCIPIWNASDEAETLAELLIDRKVVPESEPRDALHIAIAAANGVQFIATWNFSIS